MATTKKTVFFLLVTVCLVKLALARPQDIPAEEGNIKQVEPEQKPVQDLKTANSYGLGYGYGFGYPYGYYGLYGLGYGYPYYGYYGAYGYPFYG